MKDRFFTTLYWGYKSLSEQEVSRLSPVERVFVIDRQSERDNLEYVVPTTPKAQADRQAQDEVS